MSPPGQSRQFGDVRVTSAFPPDSGGLADVATPRICAKTRYSYVVEDRPFSVIRPDATRWLLRFPSEPRGRGATDREQQQQDDPTVAGPRLPFDNVCTKPAGRKNGRTALGYAAIIQIPQRAGHLYRRGHRRSTTDPGYPNGGRRNFPFHSAPRSGRCMHDLR
jgi:hypothetical protein